MPAPVLASEPSPHPGERVSPPAKTILVFGLYLLGLGLALLVAPNPVLTLSRIPATSEVWIRVVGMLVFFLGCYDVVAARSELRPFFVWSVPLRMSVIGFFGAFVAAGLAPPALLLFGAVDFAAAAWTLWALRGAPAVQARAS